MGHRFNMVSDRRVWRSLVLSKSFGITPRRGHRIRRVTQRRPACVGAPKGTGLRFHDLRHEAVSRFFEKGLNMPEVAAISGHRDPRMLMRYTHPKAEAIAVKL
jgi:integrase